MVGLNPHVKLSRSFDGQRCDDCDVVMSPVDHMAVCPACGQVAFRLLYGTLAVRAVTDAFFDPHEPSPDPVPALIWTQGVLL